MATRSTISVKLADGRVRKVYCHWDGYLDHNGSMLITHYNTQQLAEELTALGDISSLDTAINPTSPHSFDAPQEGVTVYYGRDRGETGVEPDYFDSVEAYKTQLNGEEYDYLFEDGAWTYRSYDRSPWVSVADALAKEQAATEAAD
jgi:hypothetical protein